MKDSKVLVPILLALLLIPIFIAALVIYNPGGDCTCDCANALSVVPHSHGAGLVTEITQDMQLVLNVSPAAQLYKVVDGALELCTYDADDLALKHVTVDVLDARVALGERLPVTVDLEIRDAASGSIVVQAGAPSMYAPGHGYHFGDNFDLPNDASYEWTVTVSPVQALRLEGTQDLWLEPVTWEGTFALDVDGNPTGKAPTPQLIGQITDQGIHIMLSEEEAQTLYDVTGEVSGDESGEAQTTVLDIPSGSRYYVIDITDHTVNYEEKLPGATVIATFTRSAPEGETVITVPFAATISPTYGFHYGANVALDPGKWTVLVEVSGLDFMRHAGPAVSLARGTVTGEFEYIVPDPTIDSE